MQYEPLSRTDLIDADADLVNNTPFVSVHRWCEGDAPQAGRSVRRGRLRSSGLKSSVSNSAQGPGRDDASGSRRDIDAVEVWRVGGGDDSASQTTPALRRVKSKTPPHHYIITPVFIEENAHADTPRSGGDHQRMNSARSSARSLAGGRSSVSSARSSTPRAENYHVQKWVQERATTPLIPPSPRPRHSAKPRDRHRSPVNGCTKSPVLVPYGNRVMLDRGQLNHPVNVAKAQCRVDARPPESFYADIAARIDTPVLGCSLSPRGVRVPYGTIASIQNGMYGKWVKRDLLDRRVPWDHGLNKGRSLAESVGSASGFSRTASMPSSGADTPRRDTPEGSSRGGSARRRWDDRPASARPATVVEDKQLTSWEQRPASARKASASDFDALSEVLQAHLISPGRAYDDRVKSPRYGIGAGKSRGRKTKSRVPWYAREDGVDAAAEKWSNAFVQEPDRVLNWLTLHTEDHGEGWGTGEGWQTHRRDFPVALHEGNVVPLYGSPQRGVGRGGVSRREKAVAKITHGQSKSPSGYSVRPHSMTMTDEYVFGGDDLLKNRTWGLGAVASKGKNVLGARKTGKLLYRKGRGVDRGLYPDTRSSASNRQLGLDLKSVDTRSSKNAPKYMPSAADQVASASEHSQSRPVTRPAGVSRLKVELATADAAGTAAKRGSSAGSAGQHGGRALKLYMPSPSQMSRTQFSPLDLSVHTDRDVPKSTRGSGGMGTQGGGRGAESGRGRKQKDAIKKCVERKVKISARPNTAPDAATSATHQLPEREGPREADIEEVLQADCQRVEDSALRLGASVQRLLGFDAGHDDGCGDPIKAEPQDLLSGSINVKGESAGELLSSTPLPAIRESTSNAGNDEQVLGVAEPSLAASEPQKEEDEAAEQRMLLEQQVRKYLGVLCLSSLCHISEQTCTCIHAACTHNSR